ncbi:hypothetical protein [Exiguobacterium aurantiacum]|uniref:Uncharacterized protein n=1 Tax=Exiguobacterium aurantiacum TaxID=33987 RepID=A0A377FTD2_9BACL|nr:hypothetical protein [Exiguobacterium aurantiacum]STO08079.1 Uncharacterised protein [Exiguobacterium aurantiacum]
MPEPIRKNIHDINAFADGVKSPEKEIKSSTLPREANHPQFFLSNPDWMRGARVKGGMTTYLKDAEQYAEKIAFIMISLLPKLMKDWKSLYPNPNARQFPHCHVLNGNALKRAKDIINEIYPDADYSSEYLKNIWQFGFSQGIRLVCGVNNNDEIYPFFVDYHHLLNPDKNYNQQDFASFRYCPKVLANVSNQTFDNVGYASILHLPQDKASDLLNDVCDTCKDIVYDMYEELI